MANLATDQPSPIKMAAARALPFSVAGVAGLALVTWLLNTPAGLLGKADAIGYAICHRIDSHSLHLGNRQLPLCARCTGIYLGALLGMGMMAAMGRGRAGRLPARPVLLTLFGFIGLMGIDGINSYLSFFPGLPQLYQPQNWLRAITGTLNGLALAGLIYPILNQSLWRDWEDRPVLRNFRELLALLAAAGVMIALVLSDNAAILYPLALLSAAGVVVMVVALNTVILLMALRREGHAQNWRGAALPLLAGFTLAILEIGAVDAVRYAIFHSWGGLPLG
jgi:uncharacterized membrane protein